MKLRQFLLPIFLACSLGCVAQYNPYELKMLRLFTLIALDKQELDFIERERQKVDSLIQAVEIGRPTDHELDSLRAENEQLQSIMQRYQEQIDSLNALNMELEAIQQEQVRTGRYKIAETTSELTGGYVRLYRLHDAKLSCEELNTIEVEVEHHEEGDITIFGTGMSMYRQAPLVFQVQLNCDTEEYKFSVFLKNVDGTKTNIARFQLFRNRE